MAAASHKRQRSSSSASTTSEAVLPPHEAVQRIMPQLQPQLSQSSQHSLASVSSVNPYYHSNGTGASNGAGRLAGMPGLRTGAHGTSGHLLADFDPDAPAPATAVTVTGFDVNGDPMPLPLNGHGYGGGGGYDVEGSEVVRPSDFDISEDRVLDEADVALMLLAEDTSRSAHTRASGAGVGGGGGGVASLASAPPSFSHLRPSGGSGGGGMGGMGGRAEPGSLTAYVGLTDVPPPLPPVPRTRRAGANGHTHTGGTGGSASRSGTMTAHLILMRETSAASADSNVSTTSVGDPFAAAAAALNAAAEVAGPATIVAAASEPLGGGDGRARKAKAGK
jgi:hypothetical protein